ncbi:protein PHLOEM PROTEIN 2-LIKE A9-like isoform X2 [Pistacia vera]|uniref:protein PHLOEM PROTEIN 2-LIKE A9-like isoform X2 n=1 Tax=Pistacia vera TaxID=55513 RepID=UPI0012637AEB|nr:protein PHLOEM PROTEIN 2-LIKE A9-like isoform X2 [Pistacia vera]
MIILKLDRRKKTMAKQITKLEFAVGDKKEHEEENTEISEVKKQQREEDENKGKQAKDDKLKGTEKPQREEGEEENNKGQTPEEAATTEEDKDNNINPGDLNITWGNDPRYWKLLDKRSKNPAELIEVCWLQVTGTKRVKIGKSYEIKFNISFTNKSFGWNGLPLFLMAKIGARGNSIWKKIEPLEQGTPDAQFYIPKPEDKQFIVPIRPGKKGESGEEDLFFGLYEIWDKNWKGGLRIHYATVEEVNASN